MSYIALARKYRPQNFLDVVGQEHVGKTLMNALKSNHISHAYLFSGPRGVGKTTIARILAKTLNCLDENLDARPCMKCEICKDIKAMDVIEIDGASNRGIDEIRDLRDNVKFAPLYSKYKIYIIDEVHMLTEQAFNALLKTLEEPPSHVIFIFATTEFHKIPDTILSRCQKFNFRLISLDDITNRLKFILDKENIKYEDGALNSISRASLGSMRDALSLLDQVIAYSPEIITQKETDFVLGIINSDIIFETVDNILENNSSELLKKISEILKEGFDLNQYMIQIREHYRNLMFFKVDEDLTSILEILPEDKDRYKKQTEKLSLGKITRDLKLINQAIDEIKRTDYPRVVCELYLVKLSQPYLSSAELMKNLNDFARTENFNDIQKLLDINLSEKKQTQNQKNQIFENKLNTCEKNEKSDEKIVIEKDIKFDISKNEDTKNKNIFSEKVTNDYNKTESVNADIKNEDFSLDLIKKNWEVILSKIASKKIFLRSYLEKNIGIEILGNKIFFLFDKNLFIEGVEKNKKILEDIFEEIFGNRFSVGTKLQIIPLTENSQEKEITEKNIEIENKTADLDKKEESENSNKNLEIEDEEEIPTPKDEDFTTDKNDLKSGALRYTPEDITNFEPQIKKVLDLFDGELLPPED